MKHEIDAGDIEWVTAGCGAYLKAQKVVSAIPRAPSYLNSSLLGYMKL